MSGAESGDDEAVKRREEESAERDEDEEEGSGGSVEVIEPPETKKRGRDADVKGERYRTRNAGGARPAAEQKKMDGKGKEEESLFIDLDDDLDVDDAPVVKKNVNEKKQRKSTISAGDFVEVNSKIYDMTTLGCVLCRSHRTKYFIVEDVKTGAWIVAQRHELMVLPKIAPRVFEVPPTIAPLPPDMMAVGDKVKSAGLARFAYLLELITAAGKTMYLTYETNVRDTSPVPESIEHTSVCLRNKDEFFTTMEEDYPVNADARVLVKQKKNWYNATVLGIEEIVTVKYANGVVRSIAKDNKIPRGRVIVVKKAEDEE